MVLNIKHLNKFLEINTELIQDIEFKDIVDKQINGVFSDFETSDTIDNDPFFKFYFVTDFNSCWDSKSYYQSMGEAHHYGGKFKLYAHGAQMVVDTNQHIPTIYYLIKNNTKNDLSYRIKNSAFASHTETQINIFYYRVFLVFIQWYNLTQNSSFVHASSVAYRGNAYLLSATSGIGKSSFLMAISQDPDFSFIADDLTILNKAGNAFFLGRKISVKPYHLFYFPWLRGIIMKIMPPMQKVQWKLFSKTKKLGIGLPFSSLFISGSKSDIKVKKIFHLINHNKDEFEAIEFNADDLARISNAILQTEMFLGLEFFSQINYFNIKTYFSTDTKLADVTLSVLRDIFKNVEIEGVLVPYRSNPNDLADFIKKRINI